jgi:hypothetical protein
MSVRSFHWSSSRSIASGLGLLADAASSEAVELGYSRSRIEESEGSVGLDSYVRTTAWPSSSVVGSPDEGAHGDAGPGLGDL